jgi:hypothetical protein
MSDIPERKPIISERTSGRVFDVYVAPQVDQFFADGFGRMFLGPQTTKIELYHVIGVKQDTLDGVPVAVEEREVFCRLTVPTVGLIEACGLLIEQMGANMPAFDVSHQLFKEVITNAIRKAAAVKA